MSETRVFSGMQPTGEAHLGNYLGALRQWVKLQEQADCIYCIVDYHAITVPCDATALPDRTIEMAVSFLAAALDSVRSSIVVPLNSPGQPEICWDSNRIT